MTLEEIRKICLSFPFVTEDIKWENHLCFNVGGKIFIITSPDDVPVNLSMKAREDDFISLCEQEGFSPAPYLARYKWIFVDNLDRLNKKQWTHYCKSAYQLVYDKLPKKVKESLK